MPTFTTLRIGLPVWPFHSPERMRSRERGHAVERLVHLRDDVDAVDDERALARHAQRDVEDGAVLGRVDPVAAEHRLGALAQARLLGQLEEEPQRLVGDAVLRVVEVDAGALGGEPLAAGRVLGEEVAQVCRADLGVVALERRPGRPFAQRRHRAATSRATSLTASGVNPNFWTSSFSGAEAPNVFIATIAPPSPT